MKILIVDDEQSLLDVLSVGFQFHWPEALVLTASDGASGLEVFREHIPDVVVLDVTLPRMSGFEVLREIRQISDAPVLMLTARSDEVDRVRGLELGADDYLAKPFSPLAVMAHIKAVLRRADLPSMSAALPEYVLGDLEIDFSRHLASVANRPVQLTPVEFRLLYHLARNAGRVLPHQLLLERVWGSDFGAGPHHLQVAISRLRGKIERPGGEVRIVTERGLGYRLASPAARRVVIQR
jgi:DNA-binding response OmpR family regulator